jgi:integrase
MATFEKRIGTSGTVTWRVRVRRTDGPWLTKSFKKKDDGKKWATSIEGKLDAGESVPNSEARKRTLSDAIDQYLRVTLPRAKHRKSADEQTRLLTWWKEELGSRALVGLSPSVVAEARDKLAARHSRAGKPVTGSTVNRYLTALSAVLRVTVKEYGWLQKNPVPSVSRLEDSKGRERFLSESERAALLKACAASPLPTLLPMVQLALATGARKGELFALQWAGVDLDRRSVRFLDTKNGDSRTVPLAQTAVATLTAWRTGKNASGETAGSNVRLPVGAVFPTSVNTFDKAWQAARSEAGIANFRFHDLRHSAASYLAMSGASLMDIAAILGHKTLAMVKRYSHLSEQHTTAAVDRMAEKFLA